MHTQHFITLMGNPMLDCSTVASVCSKHKLMSQDFSAWAG